MKTVSVGLIGLGGYAQVHLMALRTLQSAGGCRIVAASDPFAERHAATAGALQAEGATIYTDLSEMLARQDIDAVTIATPIHLHAPQTLAALAAGKSVYLEKPPCATLEELDAMIAAQAAGGLTARVGFQMQTSAAMRWVKGRLLAGTWGSLKTVSASVCWARDDRYYARSPWAATWRQGSAPVFDGPATNALAHVVFGALFLGGDSEGEVATPRRVRGSLMRARPVESYDSSLIEAELPGGAQIRLAFTHATQVHSAAALYLDCENARVRLDWENDVTIDRRDGSPPEHLRFPQSMNQTAMQDFVRAVESGERGLLPTLDDTRAFVQFTCGALQSSAVASPTGAANFSNVREIGQGEARIFEPDGLKTQMDAFLQDAGAVPSIFEIDSKPWIEAADTLKTLAI